MAGAHSLRTDQQAPTREVIEPRTSGGEGLAAPPIRTPLGTPALPANAVAPARARVIQPRLVVARTLFVVGIVWATLRGLHFYGLAPLSIAYDLDQPPLLLVLVGAWLAYRSRSP